MCALLVFTCVSNQRAGLWGPTARACAACNGTTQCTVGAGGPHGLGCGYTAFGQFQCAPTPAASYCAFGARRRQCLQRKGCHGALERRAAPRHAAAAAALPTRRGGAVGGTPAARERCRGRGGAHPAATRARHRSHA
jgi:hypothetical protein